MTLHDVSADKSAVRAVHAMKVVKIVNHILAERIQSVTVFDRVSSVNEVPLYSQSSVAVQYRIAVFHLKYTQILSSSLMDVGTMEMIGDEYLHSHFLPFPRNHSPFLPILIIPTPNIVTDYHVPMGGGGFSHYLASLFQMF